jgi:hypothetical protein
MSDGPTIEDLAERVDCINKNVSKILAFLARDEQRKEEEKRRRRERVM